MPKQVALKQLQDLAHEESPSELILGTSLNTELHIRALGELTFITLPFGNKFDLVGGTIIIKDKTNEKARN